jgi:lysophospholipase L1-like esterase
MATILCFGDSNTWGINPEGKRYDETQRWTTLLARGLSDRHMVIEAGQPNRTLVHNFPFSADDTGNNSKENTGIKYLKPYLIEYQPDIVLIMLGTNDLKKRYDLTPLEIEQRLHHLVEKTLRFEYSSRNSDNNSAQSSTTQVLIISPPAVYEVGAYTKIYAGAAEKSRQLAKYYSNVAQSLGCSFIDAGKLVQSCPIEGIHWQVNQHRKLADALIKKVTGILKS